jgi:hypothetical protein
LLTGWPVQSFKLHSPGLLYCQLITRQICLSRSGGIEMTVFRSALVSVLAASFALGMVAEASALTIAVSGAPSAQPADSIVRVQAPKAAPAGKRTVRRKGNRSARNAGVAIGAIAAGVAIGAIIAGTRQRERAPAYYEDDPDYVVAQQPRYVQGYVYDRTTGQWVYRQPGTYYQPHDVYPTPRRPRPYAYEYQPPAPQYRQPRYQPYAGEDWRYRRDSWRWQRRTPANPGDGLPDGSPTK